VSDRLAAFTCLLALLVAGIVGGKNSLVCS
jgi:hypothetical protein